MPPRASNIVARLVDVALEHEGLSREQAEGLAGEAIFRRVLTGEQARTFVEQVTRRGPDDDRDFEEWRQGRGMRRFNRHPSATTPRALQVVERLIEEARRSGQLPPEEAEGLAYEGIMLGVFPNHESAVEFYEAAHRWSILAYDRRLPRRTELADLCVDAARLGTMDPGQAVRLARSLVRAFIIQPSSRASFLNQATRRNPDYPGPIVPVRRNQPSNGRALHVGINGRSGFVWLADIESVVGAIDLRRISVESNQTDTSDSTMIVRVSGTTGATANG